MANFSSVIKGLFKVGKTIRQAFSNNKNKKKTSPIKRSNSLQSRIDKVTNNIPQQKELNLDIIDIINTKSKNRAIEQTEKVLNNQPVGLTKDEIEEKSYDIRRPNKAEKKLVKHKLLKGDIDLSNIKVNTPEGNSNVTGDYDLDAIFSDIDFGDSQPERKITGVDNFGTDRNIIADDFGANNDNIVIENGYKFDKETGEVLEEIVDPDIVKEFINVGNDINNKKSDDEFDYIDALEKASQPQDSTIDWENNVASQREVSSAVIEEFLGAVKTIGLDSDSADYTINFTMNMIKNYGMVEVAQFITSRPDIVTLVHENNNHYRETFADYRNDMVDYVKDLYSGLSGFIDEDEFKEAKKGNFARGWEFEGNMSKVKSFNPYFRMYESLSEEMEAEENANWNRR